MVRATKAGGAPAIGATISVPAAANVAYGVVTWLAGGSALAKTSLMPSTRILSPRIALGAENPNVPAAAMTSSTVGVVSGCP